MITVKEAIKTVIGCTSIRIEDEYGDVKFNGTRRELKLLEFKGRYVSEIDKERRTLVLILSEED